MGETDRKKILIIDDTETDIDLLMEILGKDYHLQIAMDGERAIAMAKEKPADLILLDIMMPGMDGYEVCRMLKRDEATKQIPVIFLTVLAEEQNESLGFSIGAVDYITKPFSPVIVKARIKNHLELQRQHKILQENLRLKEEIDDITKHDLKSPLQPILTLPQQLKVIPGLEKKHEIMLDLITNAGFRMLSLINNSLEITRIEKGLYEFNPVEVDVIQIIEQIRHDSENLMEMHGLTLKLYLDNQAVKKGDRFFLSAEETLCYSMLANLIKNALEASPPNKSVRVDLIKKEDSRIIIHNKGAIPEDIQDHFFNKYITHGKTNGTGLGTYTARLMCKTMGGDIKFESSQKAGSTTIYICFPSSL